MNLKFLTEDVGIPSRKFLAVTFLSSGTLAWIFVSYYAFEDIFLNVTMDLVWVYASRAIYMSLGAVFAVAGSTISEKVDRRRLLWIWITMGVLATASLLVFQGTLFALLSSILMGVSLGLGFPSCLAFLAESTKVEERARVAGTVLVGAFAMVVIAVAAYSLLEVGLIGLVLLCVVIRSTSYFALILDSCQRKEEKHSSWRSILSNKDFVFYLIPWLTFNIASGSLWFVWSGLPGDYAGAYNYGATLHYLGTGIFGLMGGIAADRFGRKQPIFVGMIMLGVSLGFLGLAPSSLSVFAYLIISGVAWGFLIVVYGAVPGDIAFLGAKEKCYTLVFVIPFVIYFALSGVADFFNLHVLPAIFSSLSILLMMILFLSIIPVLRVKETLPETTVRERKLKEHVRKVGEIIKDTDNKTDS